VNVLTRYVLGAFMRVFAGALALAISLFLIVDFFNRIDDLLRPHTTWLDIASYFALKIPTVVTQIYPAAALMGVLISLGMMARRSEITAMRACGISVFQLAVPLLGATAMLSVLMLVWNEVVVPPTASRSQAIKNFVIKQKQLAGQYNARSLWFQTKEAFVNIDYFDANRQAVYGVTVYDISPRFEVERMIEVPVATWREGAWQITSGVVRNLDTTGEYHEAPLPEGAFVLSDTPEELRSKRKKSYEYSFMDLKRQVDLVIARGMDASELLVDLHFKIASPFSGLVAVFLGFPLAVRGGRRQSIAYNISVALGVGFFYWVTMALFLSAGHAGRIPPIAAAWGANGLFGLVGSYFYLGQQG
jgi:lipopolysaccharide export system permease protein